MFQKCETCGKPHRKSMEIVWSDDHRWSPMITDPVWFPRAMRPSHGLTRFNCERRTSCQQLLTTLWSILEVPHINPIKISQIKSKSNHQLETLLEYPWVTRDHSRSLDMVRYGDIWYHAISLSTHCQFHSMPHCLWYCDIFIHISHIGRLIHSIRASSCPLLPSPTPISESCTWFNLCTSLYTCKRGTAKSLWRRTPWDGRRLTWNKPLSIRTRQLCAGP